MKKKITSIFVVLFIFSCNLTNESKGRNAYKDYLKETLKDPESLIIYNEKIEKDSNEEITYYVDYGAKNSYGGMVRETLKVVTLNGIIISTEDDYHEILIDEIEDEIIESNSSNNKNYDSSKEDIAIEKFYIEQEYNNSLNKYQYNNPKEIENNSILLFEDYIKLKNNHYSYSKIEETYYLTHFQKPVGYLKIENKDGKKYIEAVLNNKTSKYIAIKLQ